MKAATIIATEKYAVAWRDGNELGAAVCKEKKFEVIGENLNFWYGRIRLTNIFISVTKIPRAHINDVAESTTMDFATT